MVENTDQNVVEGAKQLGSAADLRNQCRKKVICLVLIILIILGIIIGVSVSHKAKLHELTIFEHNFNHSKLVMTTER